MEKSQELEVMCFDMISTHVLVEMNSTNIHSRMDVILNCSNFKGRRKFILSAKNSNAIYVWISKWNCLVDMY